MENDDGILSYLEPRRSFLVNSNFQEAFTLSPGPFDFEEERRSKSNSFQSHFSGENLTPNLNLKQTNDFPPFDGKKPFEPLRGSLTKKVLHSGISRVALPSIKAKDEVEKHYGKVLVLHLQCKNLSTMTPGSLDPFRNLKNLYLYKNSIRRIQGLDHLNKLELLDLSRNNVERIESLENCKRLKKLYLGFNEIQVVEGLEGLVELDELHLEDQDVPPEQPLIFSPGIMASVAHSLIILDVSANQLSTLQPLANLPLLDTLFASDNQLSVINKVVGVLQTLRRLRVLNLKGNPIARQPQYKAKVIGTIYGLEVLDGKDINDTTRTSLQRLQMMKEHRARKKEDVKRQELREMVAMVDDVTSATQEVPPPDQHDTSEFVFSTPTCLSPTLTPPQTETSLSFPGTGTGSSSRVSKLYAPPKYRTSIKKSTTTAAVSDDDDSLRITRNVSFKEQHPPPVPQVASNVVVDNSVYEPRARNPNLVMIPPDMTPLEMGGGGDHMSDMAKIIFRLSNLDEEIKGSSVESKVSHANYWEVPASSMTKECRPLSPLEGLENLDISSATSAPDISLDTQASHANKRSTGGGSSSRPKPAPIGGRRPNLNIDRSAKPISDDSPANFTLQTTPYYYGRTLSPLVELPTPESATARDDNSPEN